jgi:hypothetical protein
MSDRNIINLILERAEDKKFANDYAVTALKWYHTFIKSRYKHISRHDIRNAPNVRQVVRPTWGGMYTFRYVPKGKDSLPYYDSWPLVIPFKRITGGKIYAFNLHYLPPKKRVKVLFGLSNLMEEAKINNISSGSSDYFDLNTLNVRWFHTDRRLLKDLKKCTRTYLISHIRGKPIEFPTHTWPIVSFLPIARWRKVQSPKLVWKDLGF